MQPQLSRTQRSRSKSPVEDCHDTFAPEILDAKATEKATVWVIDRGAKWGKESPCWGGANVLKLPKLLHRRRRLPSLYAQFFVASPARKLQEDFGKVGR